MRQGYTSVDTAYTALQRSWGKLYFPDVANEGEQIQVMADFFEQAKPILVNPYEQYSGEVIEEIANDIVQDVVNGVLRPNPPTTVDRWKGKVDAAKDQVKEQKKVTAGVEKEAQALRETVYDLSEELDQAGSRYRSAQATIRELERQGELSEKEAQDLRETVYDLSVALDAADSRYRTLKTSADIRMAQVREEGKARAAEKAAQQKAKDYAKIDALKQRYQQMARNARDRRNEAAGVTKYRKQVIEKSQKLSDWLLKNSDKEHVPEVLKAPLLDFLTSIDYTSKRALNGGAETQADRKFGARLQRLEQLLRNQQSYINGDGSVQEDLGGYIDIGPDMLSFLRDMAKNVTDAMAAGTSYTINQMNAQQLKDLSNLLSSLSSGIRNMNSLMANARYTTVRQAASQDIDYMNSLGKAPDSAGGKLSKFLQWKESTPYYAFKRFGKGGQAIFDGLTRGWEKLAFNAREIIDFTEKTYTDKEVNEWKKEIHEITLDGGQKIRMSTAQIMELSELLNREQAMKHLDTGGMRIGNIEQKRGTVSDVKHYHLTPDDIANILGELTPRQQEVADKLQQYMAQRGGEWGNEVSMKRFGYNFYTEGEHYYPIRTDSNDRAMQDTDAQENSMFRLLNLSSSKSLKPKVSNALVVGDIFDTFADHMADQAKLNALGLPILDAIKWFNYKEKYDIGDGRNDTRTLQAAMEKAYQGEAQHYFRTLIKDVNGVTESGDRGTDVVSKMVSNYKVAAVAANLRVALLQPTAYVRALTLITPQNLARAFAYKNGIEEALKWSGTALWKDMGYYDTNISRNMRQQIQHNETWKDKVQEASMKGAEYGDKRTWGRLWVACRLQTEQMHPELTGDKLMQATADLFRDVVYSSQVMDSTLTRSELMRGKSQATKALTAFMAEPTLSYNVLLDFYSELQNDIRRFGKQGAWKRNKDKLGRAFTVYVASATVSAIAESMMDAARDDDDYESYVQKFLQAMFGEDNPFEGNWVQDLLITGKIPYAKNIVSRLSGFSSSTDMSTQAIDSIVQAAQVWQEVIQLNGGLPGWIKWVDVFDLFEPIDKATKKTYYGNMTDWGKIYKTLQAASQASGLPAGNLTRDAVAIWNTTIGNMVPYWKIKTYDKGAKANIKDAYASGYLTFQEAADQMIKSGAVATVEDAEKELTKSGSRNSPEMDNMLDAILNGDIDSALRIRQNMTAHGTPEGYITTTVQGEVKDHYLAGNLSYEKAQAALTNYGGMSAADAGYELKWWEFTDQNLKAVDTNENKDISQTELGNYLLKQVNAGKMTNTEADALWRGRNVGVTAPWKTGWEEWKAKQK